MPERPSRSSTLGVMPRLASAGTVRIPPDSSISSRFPAVPQFTQNFPQSDSLLSEQSAPDGFCPSSPKRTATGRDEFREFVTPPRVRFIDGIKPRRSSSSDPRLSPGSAAESAVASLTGSHFAKCDRTEDGSPNPRTRSVGEASPDCGAAGTPDPGWIQRRSSPSAFIRASVGPFRWGRILTLPPPETAGVRYAGGVSAISPGFHPGVSRPQDSPTPEGWQSFNPSGVDRTFRASTRGGTPG